MSFPASVKLNRQTWPLLITDYIDYTSESDLEKDGRTRAGLPHPIDTLPENKESKPYLGNEVAG